MAYSITIDLGLLGKGFLSLCAPCLLVYAVLRLKARNRHSALRDMPGPAALSWLWGSSREMPEFEARWLQLEWIQKYGRTFKIRSFLMTDMLYVGDPKALTHVLTNSAFERTPGLRRAFQLIIGPGILSAEGMQHKRQRRVLNPAFGPIELRKQTEIFVAKSNELCRIWKKMCSESKLEEGHSTVTLDAFAWLNKATLDIITLAGFSYDTDSLNASDDQPNEVITAIRNLLAFDMDDPFFLLQLIFPIFRLVPSKRLRQLRQAQKTVRGICMRLIEQKKAAVLKGRAETDAKATIRKHDIGGSDLLSLLIKANLAADLPESLRLDDEDILAQAPTFVIAGHETTSSAVSWALFALTCAPKVQQKLRHELWSVSTDTPSMDELNALPYLDKVVREVMRLYSPIMSSERIAVRDDIIPLDVPYTDNKGVLHHEIVVSKGDVIFVPIYTMHTSTEIWGPDAHQFRPERWGAVPEAAKQLPNIWGNLVSFVAGPHACIGYRFAIVETKALLFALIRSFELELAISPAEIIRKTDFVGRPSLATNPSAGCQLPLTIRPAVQE